MKQYISTFLDKKGLSKNSYLAYLYDLQQFVEICQEQVTSSKLAIYQASIQECKPSVQKRKLSAVNQFLYFLYEEHYTDRFYRLKASPQVAPSQMKRVDAVDLSPLWQDTPYHQGQLIALLIICFGVTPSEIALMRQEDVDLSFQIVTLTGKKGKRILPLPAALIPYLDGRDSVGYLFDKKGSPYSRQWFFNRLKEFVTSLNHKEWTAQFLREQYIRTQLESGQTVDNVAKNLGLASTMSLEKYRSWI